MKWLAYLFGVLVSISLIFLVAIIQGPIIYLGALYGGLFTYWAFRSTIKDRTSAIKKIIIIGTIITIILIIQNLVVQHLQNQMQALSPNVDIAPLFPIHSIFFLISYGLIFIAIPALLASGGDNEDLIRNPILVLFFVILTLGFYQLYWFWLIKKGLEKNNIKTISLWWVLLPIVGTILIYIDFSKALEQRTQRKFLIWLLIFFFINGLDIVINQAILNHDLLKQKI